MYRRLLPRRFTAPYSLTLISAVILACCLSIFAVWYFYLRTLPPSCSGDFDLAVVGAEIIDGLGGRPFKADIGIRQQHIACIGTIDPRRAREIVDGSGLQVAPGFIDVHTHVERNVPMSSTPFLAPNFVRQGVTTIITGNCGRSFLDIGKAFRLLETNGAQINIASLVGHNTIRLHVMNENSGVPTPAQLNQMKGLVRTAMHDGALGLSTGLEYIPGAFAKTDEIAQLAKTVTETNGLYASHIRDEGPNGVAAIKEAISIGERTGIHVHISHFKAQGPNQWRSAQLRLDLVKSAEQKGLVVSLDQYPYTASSTTIGILVPSWLSEGGLSAARQKLNDPTTRVRVRNEMLNQLRVGGWQDYSFARVSYCGFDHSLVGRTIPEISRAREASSAKVHARLTSAAYDSASAGRQENNESDLERQADTVIDLFSHGDAQMVFFNMNEEDVETIMRDPEVMFGSDSGVREETALALPHPRGLGTFPRILGVYAREKHLFSMEEAVRRMTSLPAATFGLKDRGQIREGFWADLVVFDRDHVVDKSTYDQPLKTPEGIHYVIVNGSLVMDRGRMTKSSPGMVLRHS